MQSTVSTDSYRVSDLDSVCDGCSVVGVCVLVCTHPRESTHCTVYKGAPLHFFLKLLQSSL